ncbi:major facilitator superfamily muropeptide transporter [Idiomarina xiamenensis 10-D-4]|uniref:Major facilitator superfamily muropeptide transporter n=1 Tax=Idiomarina xiamenensis 10-D-4 TaxID=740709 RepID=K2K8E5_9GAMM|nr:major facilitator superfamily muropeptide transporter [Idiomarina xiamenensis 10-D-4]
MLGIASGFPWVLIGSALTAWLQEAGETRSTIGLFGVVFTMYSINMLWSPLVDTVRIPWLTQRLGQRRSWLVVCQLIIAAACFCLGSVDVTQQLWSVALLALIIAIASATQDIAIDAYRIESFSEHEARLQSAGAAMATAGWWTGYSGLGAIPFFIVGDSQWQWQDAYQVLAALTLLFVIRTLQMKEPLATQVRAHLVPPSTTNKAAWRAILINLVHWLKNHIYAPVAEFFQRSGWKVALSLLLFILLFKIGEAFLGKMSIVFYKEVGFSNEQIGFYSKLVTWWITIVFSILGSLVNLRAGIVKGLFIGGLAMAASNLLFAWIAVIGPKEYAYAIAVLIDGFTSAWSTVAFVAFISLLCNRAFTATQYALLASLGNLGRTLLSSYSGFVIDGLGGDWTLFFIITALMVLPSLLLLFCIRKTLYALEQAHYQKSQYDG